MLPITTKRLVLRALRMDDLDAVHAYRSLPEVMRYLYPQPQSREQVRDFIAERSAIPPMDAQGQKLTLAIEVDGAVTGEAVLIMVSPEQLTGEIGYVVHPDFAGRGIATEAGREMLRLGFESYGLRRMIGRLDGRNEPSARVLARLGMRREAHFVQNEFVKGEWADEVVYAMLHHEWHGGLQ
jgi:RimJ/RimL family protein N-acetyltransferase